MKTENKIIQWVSHGCLGIISLLCLMPFVLLISSSLSDENTIISNGYSFFPKKFSFTAYNYLWSNVAEIFHAYGITIIITIVGTAVSLLITTLLAYPLSRRDLPYRNFFTFIVFFTLLFNGGLVPTYLVYTEVLHIKNTIWALIFPGLLMSGFNVLLMRTFFIQNIPVALLESARIDGASEFKIFYKIVLPLSLPILATIGLFQTIGYWNDWFNGMIYVTDPNLFSIQVLLNNMLTNIQFLSSTDLGSSSSQSMAQLPSQTVRMAIAVIGVIPILIVYPFFQKYFIKGITIGAVKE